MAKKQLNSNNFLRWSGNFRSIPFDCIAVNDTAEIHVEEPTGVYIDVLSNDTATYGIDQTTFEFVTQDNTDIPATYNSSTGLVRYFLPEDAEVGQVRVLSYRWKDSLGNYSNTAIISITVLAQPGLWFEDESSAFCVLDEDGHNTGMIGYAQLIRYEGNPPHPVVPNEFKPNDPDDPDYIPPYEDLVACPLYVPPLGLRLKLLFLPSLGGGGLPPIDPLFRLVSYELRKMSDNTLVQGATVNMAVNSTVTEPNVDFGNYKLILNFTGGLADGVEKWAHLQDGGDIPDLQYTGPAVVFTNIDVNPLIEVIVNQYE